MARAPLSLGILTGPLQIPARLSRDGLAEPDLRLGHRFPIEIEITQRQVGDTDTYGRVGQSRCRFTGMFQSARTGLPSRDGRVLALAGNQDRFSKAERMFVICVCKSGSCQMHDGRRRGNCGERHGALRYGLNERN